MSLNPIFIYSSLYSYLLSLLSNITGILNTAGGMSSSSETNNALYVLDSGGVNGNYTSSTASVKRRFGIDASRSNGLYGANKTVQPPAIKNRVKTRYK